MQGYRVLKLASGSDHFLALSVKTDPRTQNRTSTSNEVTCNLFISLKIIIIEFQFPIYDSQN